VAWLLAGSHAVLTLPGPAFLSWSAFSFLVTGIFVAPFIFGLPVYALQKGLAQRPGLSAQTVTWLSLALLLGEAVLVALAARGIYLQFVAGPFAGVG
jgi:hypothetical protein